MNTEWVSKHPDYNMYLDKEGIVFRLHLTMADRRSWGAIRFDEPNNQAQKRIRPDIGELLCWLARDRLNLLKVSKDKP